MGCIQSKRYKIRSNCNGRDATLECSRCTRLFHSDCLKYGVIVVEKNWFCIICSKSESFGSTDKVKDLKILPTLVTRMMIDRLMMLKKLETAELLQNLVADEIDELKKCGECYANANAHADCWFTMVCDEPHLLAWAKFCGCNYWPVKVMSVDGRMLSVRCFDDHTHANITAFKCYLYSEQSPGKSSEARGTHYKTAMNEVSMYIENIRQKFGAFNYAMEKMVFDPMLHTKYTMQMFPRPTQHMTRRSSDIWKNIRRSSALNAMTTVDLDDLNQTLDDDGSEVLPTIDLTEYRDADRNAAKSSQRTESTNGQHKLKRLNGYKIPKKRVRFSIDTAIDPVNEHDVNQMDHQMEMYLKVTTCHISTIDTMANDTQAPDTAQLPTNTIALNGLSSEEIAVNHKLNQKLDELNEQKATLIAELDVVRMEKDREIAKLQLEMNNLRIKYSEMEEQQSKMLADAEERYKHKYKMEFTKLVDESKKLKFCSGCGITKPLDTFYFCDDRCQKQFYDQLPK